MADLAMPASGTLPLSMALDPDDPELPGRSMVGSATAVTPLLDVPLTGPVYFIKNVRTDAKTGRQIKTLPTFAAVLQGAGVGRRSGRDHPDDRDGHQGHAGPR
ncbi:MAG TPA: hypothetical protein VGM33_15775 [Baekduia sp.]|jgi:hypothetical protein